ncbi:MAG: cytochrome c oxidase subunit 3 [Saprospiraceae bacterium]|nr:cytochrome c oxidase subunit 3 [Saprospiraceae bacterium]
MDVAVKTEEKGRNKIHPQKFALLAALAGIMMMFAAFTSAFVVRRAAGNWLEFRLPDMFFYNTGVILLSSLTMHSAYYFFKKGNVLLYRSLLVATLILGLTFVYLQYQGWVAMYDIGLPISGPVSGSFIYLISGVHAAHVLGGIAVLVVALLHAIVLPFKVTPRRKLRFEMSLIYWHFVDFLWVYLLIFFVLQS